MLFDDLIDCKTFVYIFSFFLSKEEAIDRRTYIPPDNYDTEAMKQFRSYLEEKGVEGTFKNMVKLLLNRPTLPYNPYPGFVLRFRQYAEKLVSQPPCCFVLKPYALRTLLCRVYR